MTSFSFRIMMFGAAAALGWAGVAATADAAPDFRGKRINVVIGSSPGGGTDGTSRLVGRYLQKYLPGRPQMIYRNMPAGHGVKANNYFYNEVKPDELFARKDVDRLCSECHDCSRPIPRGWSDLPLDKRQVCSECHRSHGFGKAAGAKEEPSPEGGSQGR